MKNLVFWFLLLTGCASQVINLSVLEPAENTISPNVKSISLLPLAGYPDRPGQFDSLSAFIPDTTCDYNKIKLAYLYGMHEILSQSSRFKMVKITDTSWLNNVNSGKIDKELIHHICLHDSTDAVLLILKVVAYDFYGYLKDGVLEIDANRDLEYMANLQDDYKRTILEHPNGTSKNCVFFYRLVSDFKIGLFSPFSFEYPDVIEVKEVFDMYRPGECHKFRDMKEQKELIYNSCFFTGNQVGNRLTPLWKDNQKRYLYKDLNPYLLEANDLAIDQKWDEAADLWESLAYNHIQRVESKASYNLAVKAEREDDLNNARFWIERADSIRSSRKVKAYRSLLEERLTKRVLLDQQMP